MNYREICVQADLALRDLNSLRQKYEVVFYVGRKEWRELCDNATSMGNESTKKKDARFYGCQVHMMDTESYFGAGLEIVSDYSK